MKAPKKEKRTLACSFTPEELASKRDRLAASVLEYDVVDAERKECGQTYREQLLTLRAEMKVLSNAIRSKEELREVECVTEFHKPGVGFKETKRLDTGEVVSVDAMSDDEKQGNLFDECESLEQMFAGHDPRDEREASAGKSEGNSRKSEGTPDEDDLLMSPPPDSDLPQTDSGFLPG